jgi:hypothetical protein
MAGDYLIFWTNHDSGEDHRELFDSLDEAAEELARWAKAYPWNTYHLARVIGHQPASAPNPRPNCARSAPEPSAPELRHKTVALPVVRDGAAPNPRPNCATLSPEEIAELRQRWLNGNGNPATMPQTQPLLGATFPPMQPLPRTGIGLYDPRTSSIGGGSGGGSGGGIGVFGGFLST